MIKDKTLPHAIFLDIDGTLMQDGGAILDPGIRIPQKNVEVIRKVRALGHKVLINTGRAWSFLPEEVYDSTLFDGYVLALGTYIKIGGRLIYSRPIPHDVLAELLKIALEEGRPCRFQGEKLFSVNLDAQTARYWDPVYSVDEFMCKLCGGNIWKITVDRDLAGNFREYIDKTLNLYASENAGEAAVRGCDKAKGMMIALEHLGIPLERSIAFGDGINDMEVLGLAGTSVAMANASKKVRDICDHVTDNAENGGVGQMLEKLLCS